MSETLINPEFWMTQLPPQFHTFPIIQTAIPGSHNSFTYSITRHSWISPDSPYYVQRLSKYFGRIASFFVYGWSVCQDLSVTQQLNSGIRYFDIRLGTNSSEIYVVHGMYGSPIIPLLYELRDFLDKHETEIVILDFQHFYRFQPQDHFKLIESLREVFGSRLCECDRSLVSVTFGSMWALHKQVLVVYRHYMGDCSLVWPSEAWPTPWPNTMDVRSLQNYLNRMLERRGDTIGFVSQCILTPSVAYVTAHVFSSLRRLAGRCNRGMGSWIDEQTTGPGAGRVNVVVCDFSQQYDLIKRIIQLNYKLAAPLDPRVKVIELYPVNENQAKLITVNEKIPLS